jgi:hypothetical protein
MLIWREFAQKAKGQVRVVIGSYDYNKVYSRIEKPELLENLNVLGIDELIVNGIFKGQK